MISNEKNEGQSEFGNIVVKDLYKVQDYPKDYFDYIIDVGANIGIFSVMMRMLHPNAKIFAFEPHEETYSYLLQNTNMLNIHTERLALGDGSKLYFQERPDKHILNHMFVKKKSEHWAKSITLYSMIEKYGLDLNKRYILKFDCEGGERSLLQTQGSETVLKKAEHISMEIHFKSKSTPYDHWLSFNDYDAWMRSNFQDTHDIEYYCSRKNQGFGHYCLRRKDA